MEQTQWTPMRTALKRHEAAAHQRVLQLEQARQNHQITPGTAMKMERQCLGWMH
jgi:hypothetical protein